MKTVISSQKDAAKKICYQAKDHFFYSVAFCQNLKLDDVMTVCVSSQVGCVESCRFCATGDQNFIRNLRKDEIQDEILDGIDSLSEYYIANDIPTLHVIFEGMGEASYNIDNCVEAFKSVYSRISSMFQKIVLRISTVGNVALAEKYISFVKANKQKMPNVEFQIKFSLHTPFDEERRYLMPKISTKYNLDSILSELYKCSDYFETPLICNYVLFDYLNGKKNYTEQHMEKLTSILKNTNTKILLGTYSETGKCFKSPPQQVYDDCLKKIKDKGFWVEKTKLKGQDIMAACGMLEYKARINGGKIK